MNASVQEKRTWWGGKRRVEDRALSTTAQTTTSPSVMLDLAAPGAVMPANAMAIGDVMPGDEAQATRRLDAYLDARAEGDGAVRLAVRMTRRGPRPLS